jgi:hypothetical protein
MFARQLFTVGSICDSGSTKSQTRIPHGRRHWERLFSFVICCIPVDALCLLSKRDPMGRQLLQSGLYGLVHCLCRALFGIGRSLSVVVRP